MEALSYVSPAVFFIVLYASGLTPLSTVSAALESAEGEVGVAALEFGIIV